MEATPGTKKHFAHVSIRELTALSSMQRQEIKHDLTAAEGLGMGIVELTSGGLMVPAAITLRTTVNQQTEVGRRIRDNWHVVLAPADSEGLMRRLFAERNSTDLGSADVPIAGIVEASYDAVRALNTAHEHLSALEPPRPGTFLEMTFAITRGMGRVITFRPSSVEVLRRARGWAKHHNELEIGRWRARHFPLSGPVNLGPWRIWPWWGIQDPDLEVEPEIPDLDSWAPGGELYEKIGEIVAEHFAPILESLWKAAFKQDPFISAQLKAQGFNLDAVDATRLGIGPLLDLMGKFRKNPAHMTMMAPDDIIRELGEDAIRALTRQGNTHFDVQIEDTDD